MSPANSSLVFWTMLAVVSCGPSARAQQAAFVWLEGESPSAANVEPKREGWGNVDFLSGGHWLSYSVDAEKVDREVPKDGIELQYAFQIVERGSYQVWSRIGFEFVRSPFEWRIDGGSWTAVSPEELTTDLMEIGVWCEVAWLKLGDRQLDAGDHRLEIRLPRTKNDKDQTNRILFACDAICLSAGDFSPNSKFKPDQDGRDDRDRQAAEQVFVLPEPAAPAARSAIALAGLWEICRHDEQQPGETAAPIGELPKTPHWKAIPVPGDKNQLRPDLLFAHRLWYRTRVQVPQSCAGRSFHLVFPQNNLNTTVYVNGAYCGFDKNPFARVQIDVTAGMRPGENEIWVGIHDAWYAYSSNPDRPLKLRKRFNLPVRFFSEGFQDLAYPIWHHPESGMLATPELVAAGSTYASDVFCKPSVTDKQLALEVTLTNPTAEAARGEVVCEAVGKTSGQVEKTFVAQEFSLTAGQAARLAITEPWEDPKLWWPDDPQQYALRTTVKIGGRPVDVSETIFGFRQWTWQGRDFRLNGIVWHGWADCFRADTPEEWLRFYRATNQRMMRFWGTRWMDLPPDQALEFFDRSGVVVRRSGLLDGQAIGNMAIENDPELKARYGSEVKIELMHNWRDQMLAQVRGERNHPSVMIWSLENEFLYINCINLYGGLMDQFEAEVTKVSEAVLKTDPTRPTMVDGGGACLANSLPVHGDHYVFKDYPRYPDLAYEANPTGGGRGRWQWDEQRPRFIGEDYFANGINPFDYSYFGGEETFQGKAQSHRAAGIIFRMLTEGYRWAGYGAWHFWMGQNEAENQYNSNSPRAVFCRQWDWTFRGGQQIERTLRVFNDSRFDDPLHLDWSLVLDARKIASGQRDFRVPAGASQECMIQLALPAVSARTEGSLLLVLRAGDEEVFRDEKLVSVLPAVAGGQPPAALAKLKAADLLVHDPMGGLTAFLGRAGVPYTPLADLQQLPDSGRVLLVGKDAIASTACDSSRFRAWASPGRSVIVLEQTHPLRYQALPADAGVSSNEGRTAFVENLEHPAFVGLTQQDFFAWSGDHVVYRNAYDKPTRGGRSLVQCDHRLQKTALLEAPCGQGLMLLSQLAIGEKLEHSAAAGQLMLNLIAYAAQYRLEHHPVVICTRGIDPQLVAAMQAMKLNFTETPGPLEALHGEGPRTAVIPASAENLKLLVQHTTELGQLTAGGGHLLLHALTPEGLADYNRIVGWQHMIRPFWRERVGFPPVKHPLTAGLTTGDVVMRSGERIFGWTSDEYVASDIFTHVVDVDDVAPFAAFPDEFVRNLVNGMVSADAWKYIVNVPTPPPGERLQWTLRLPQEQEIERLEWIGNTFYYPVTKAALIFDGREDEAFVFDTLPNNDPQTIDVVPPRRGRDITLRLVEWDVVADKRPVTGLDNLSLFARRPDEFRRAVQPLLNVGGLVHYQRGEGGIVLCNLDFQESETVPENAVKKRRILATLLRNLQAPFAEGKAIVPGTELRYEPLDIAAQCNQYRDQRGWFGDAEHTFQAMPQGRQLLAGVPFEIYEFPTSPVPNAIMLRGNRVPGQLPETVRGIPVGRTADALFFLHTARIDTRRNERDIRDDKRYELLRYVVHYADGQQAVVPVYAEIDIDDYHQQQPRAIPGAQLAWIRPYEGSDRSAVAYSMQWSNPRPEVVIQSIDMQYGEHRRGVPALIAVTAASDRPARE